jgi:histone-arginine methyltransferase CARM1
VGRSADALILTVNGVDHVSVNRNVMPTPERAFVVRFLYDDDLEKCVNALQSAQPSTRRTGVVAPKPPKRARASTAPPPTNAFDAKTDSASAAEYFRYYGLLPQQQNMLQDAVRTGTYFTAILGKLLRFQG